MASMREQLRRDEDRLEAFLLDIEIRCLPVLTQLWNAGGIFKSKRHGKAMHEAIRLSYEMGYRQALREAAAGHRGKLYKDNHYALPEGIQ